jgi:anti-anti-sigma factor
MTEVSGERRCTAVLPWWQVTSCDETPVVPGTEEAPGRPAEFFGMRVRAVADVVVVELGGELDILAEEQLTPRLDMLTCLVQPAVLMDLSGVTFMDASGLRLLLRARARVLAHRGTLRIVPDRRWVPRILRLTGTRGGFCLLSDLPSGLAGGQFRSAGDVPA